VDALNRQGYVDVQFTGTRGGGIQVSTVVDADPEWVLGGAAAAGVTVLQSGVESIGNDVFRYRFEGRFVEGPLRFETLGGSVQDNNGHGNLSTRTELRVEGLRAVLVEPGPKGVLSASAIQAAGRLRFRFDAPFGTGLDLATIEDAAPEVALTGSASSGVVLSGVGHRVEIDGQSYIDYTFSGTFGTGEVGVELLAGSWADTHGNLGQASRSGFTVAVDASAFFIRITGFVALNAAGFTPDLDGDGSPDPLLRVRGEMTLEFLSAGDGDVSRMTLSMSGSTEVFGLGFVGAAAGSVTMAFGGPAGGDGWLGGGFPAVWGALRLQVGLGPAAAKLGLAVEAETTIRFNSTSEDRILELNLPGSSEAEVLTLRARTFSLGGSGRIVVADVLRITGAFALEIGPDSASLSLDGRTELAFGEITVLGRVTWLYG
ncbi:MAG: hypothetical protein ACKPGI_00455, partial [Verrucomicrobiota bacterium]